MGEDLPHLILEKYADQTDTTFNGTFDSIPAEQPDVVLADLGQLGFRLLRDQRLEQLLNATF